MKILALDIGDVWTGSAISDPLGIIARPYKTTSTHKLIDFLKETLQKEPVTTILVGYPKTMKGTESEQTKKTVDFVNKLKELFQAVTWVLWDERLSSKRANAIKQGKKPADKQASHSAAAAFILSSYLEYRHLHANDKE